MTSPHRILVVAVLAAMTLATLGCGGSGNDDSSSTSSSDGLTAIRVPQDVGTIQGAVDQAEEGDLILVDEGVYREAVDVTTPNITIRGVDRNAVVLDGGFELENGMRVLDTDGVVVENMTARNFVSNGFFWTGSDYYRGSYLTAYRNGDYGLYAFDAYHGQFDHSYGSGSPDAGFYIGECFKCDAVMDAVVSEYNGLGYSGTNSGGDLYIVNSEFAHNRAGVVPNSGAYELCYPSRETTVAGNRVHDNNYLEGPGIDVSLLAQGNGILVAGAVRATITKNLVYGHDRLGIALVPYPEEDANALAPPATEWDTPCQQTHDQEVPPIDPTQCKEVAGLLKACAVIWNPIENTVTDNEVSGSGIADLGVGTIDPLGTGQSTETLGNCFAGNGFSSSAPASIEVLAPCGETGSGDWNAGALDLAGIFLNTPEKPSADSYKSTPEPAAQDNMPDARTKPAERFTGPVVPNLGAIVVPTMPAN
jgi:hypothetical protein